MTFSCLLSSSKTTHPFLRRIAPSTRATIATITATVAVLGLSLAGSRPAEAVYTFGSDVRNTTAPTGALAGSGWQYGGFIYGGGNNQLDFPNDMGWPVAPNWFLQSHHTVKPNDWPFVYNGETYNVLEEVRSPLPPNGTGSDLSLIHVDHAFPTWAPLYTGRDEVGKDMVINGFGSLILDPSNPMYNQTNGNQVGWSWKEAGRQYSWGTNKVNETVTGRFEDYLRFTFDEPTLDDGSPNPNYSGPNEAGVAPTDSGAGIFIQEDGIWKLAGLLYGIDAQYDYDGQLVQPGGFYDPFWGAIYDGRGLYQNAYDDQGNDLGLQLITGDNPVPFGMYASRVSSELDWIQATTGWDPHILPPGVGAPEPGSLLLMGIGSGILVLGGIRRRSRKQQ